MLHSYHKGELRLAVVHNYVAIVYIILLFLVIATHIVIKCTPSTPTVLAVDC